MDSCFISKERKISGISGMGIQYIPGHSDPFTDFAIEKLLPPGEIDVLDLGGGGLRFAIPAAVKGRMITVVDLDHSGLDLDLIYRRLDENGYTELPEKSTINYRLKLIVDNLFDFLENKRSVYPVITAFRLIHFLSPDEVNTFFNLSINRLCKNGILIVSALSPFEEDNKTYNEIYKNSIPSENNLFYRRFLNNAISNKLRKEQNLGKNIHLFTGDYMRRITRNMGIRMEMENLYSTRMARGFVFKKQWNDDTF